MSVTINKLGPSDSSTGIGSKTTLEAEVTSDTGSDINTKIYGKRRFDADLDFRFIVMTDLHWGQESEYEENLINDALPLIQELHNQYPFEFLIANGDIVHDDETLHQEIINQFFSELPQDLDWYPVFGNHDWSTDTEWQNDYGISKQHTFETQDYGFIITETGVERDSEEPENYTGSDPGFIENSIDGFTDKEGVFIFQHISSLETEDDYYAAPDSQVRQQFARDEVKMVFHGHHHGINTTREIENAFYSYGCRIGGVDLTDGNGEVLDDWGFRVVEVYEDGTVHTRQVPLNLEDDLNSDAEYDAENGFRLLKEETVESGSVVSYDWRSLLKSSRYYWYVEAEEV